jgi:hypothetical protein
MNILAKTKRWFPAPVRVNGIIERYPQFQDFICSWNTLLASPTEQFYNQKLAEIQTKYPLAAIQYCANTWLLWKENLVACYINQRYHFGVTVTSPIEGCHATLKTCLQRGHGGLAEIFSKLKLFWTDQHQKIQTAIAQQQIRPRHSTNIPLFAAILKQVHGYALRRILVEHAKLPARGEPPASCTCSIRQSIGLPCYHTIYQRNLSSGVIYLEDIPPHWYFSRPEPGLVPAISHPLPVLNPLVMQGRGRPRGALGIGGRVEPTSTRREPSAFELPSSSAPPAFQAPQERLSIVNPGLSRLQNGHQDLYQPGTLGPRAYMRGLSSIWQTEVDTARATAELIEKDVIEVDDDTIEVETTVHSRYIGCIYIGMPDIPEFSGCPTKICMCIPESACISAYRPTLKNFTSNPIYLQHYKSTKES